MQTTTVRKLIERYDALLLDAYGVLVDAQGALPGASAFIEALIANKKPFLIVTNDASRSEKRIAERFLRLGLPIEAEQVITSGGLLPAVLASRDLKGTTAAVVGSSDSKAYVAQGGVTPIDAINARDHDIRAIISCDNADVDFAGAIEAILDVAISKIDRAEPLDLILCNPDLIYPRAQGRYGLTSGTTMLVIEHALATRFDAASLPKVVRLGKPFREIFDAATLKLGTRNVAMVGDQLATDIRGAKSFGIASVLVGTGLTRVIPGATLSLDPDYFLPSVGPLQPI